MSISKHEFQIVARFIYGRASLVLKPGKEYLVEARLGSLARQRKTSLSQIIEVLRVGGSPLVEAEVVDLLTTHETSFYRDQRVFDDVFTRLLPELIERNRRSKSLTIWCAACSTGQEPYSIAIRLTEEHPEIVHGWNVNIIAMDISSGSIAYAKDAHYTDVEVSRGLNATLKRRYFTKGPEGWKLTPAITRMVRYEVRNLTGSYLGLRAADVIFLRNVLIYFDLKTKSQIVKSMWKHLRPDGEILVGSSESLRHHADEFEPVREGAPGVYRRRELHGAQRVLSLPAR